MSAIRKILISFLACAGLCSFSSYAQQGPKNLNVSGGLFLPSGSPVTQSSVNFRLEVWDKNATCILYSESHLSQDLSGSKGGFSLPLGKGSSPTNYLESSALFTAKIFENSGPVAGTWPNCPSGTNLMTGDERVIRVYYDLGAGMVAMTPDVPIASSAYAMVADTLQGKAPTDFIQVNDDVTHDLTQANVNDVFSSTNFPRLQQLLAPTASLTFGNQRLTDLATPTAATDAATKGYTDGNLAGAAIDLTDVAPGFGNGKVLTWDSAQAKWVATVPSIGAASIGTSELADGSVTRPKLAPCANNEILRYVGSAWTCTTIPVLSVAGKTGAVTLNAMDIGGLGTAALHDVGVGATQVPLLDVSGKLAASTIPLFSGDVTGAISANVVTALQGRPVAAVAPNPNEILRWNGSRWEAGADQGITALTGDISASGSGSVAATLTDRVVTTPKMFNNPGRNRLVATDATTGALLVAFECNLDEIMHWTTNGWACVSVSAAAAGASFQNNGNTFAGPATLGTNDIQPLYIETNDTTRMAILANGNVGIGTTSPARLLEVAGAVRINPSTTPSTPVAGDFFIDSAAGNSLKYHNGSSWISLAVSATGDFMANGSVPMTGAFRAVAGTASAPGMTFVGDTANGIFAPSGNVLGLATNGVERLRVDSSGRIGVGVSSPASAFHMSTSGGTTLIVDSYGSSGSSFIGRGAAGSPGSPGSSQPGDVLMFLGSRGYGTSGFAASSSSAIKMMASEAMTDSAQGGNITFETTAIGMGASNRAERMRITSAGYVGIGTTNPSRILEVTGPMRLAPSALPGSPAAGDVVIDSGNANTLKFHNGSTWVSVAASSSIVGTTGYVPQFSSGSTLGNSPVFVSGANIGIGTTAPTAKIQVGDLGTNANNYLMATGVSASMNARHYISNVITYYSHNYDYSSGTKDYASATGASIGIQGQASSNLPIISFNSTTPTGSTMSPLISVLASGNVGIGTTSPARVLNTSGPIRINPTVLPGSPGAGDLAFDSSAGNILKYHDGNNWVSVAGSAAISGTTGYHAKFTSGGTVGNSAIFESGSNVGVGTTSPSSNLDVAGTFRTTGTSLFGSTLSIQSGQILNVNGSPTFPSYSFTLENGIGLYRPAAGSLGIATSQVERVRIDGTGNVGIGTTSPNRLLEVAGAMRLAPSSLPGTPAAGDMAIDVASGNALKYHNGSSWISLAVGGTGDFKADGSIPMTGTLKHIAGTAAAPGITFASDTANGIFAPSANSLGIATSGTERMRVLANGNVGIGTTNPAGLLGAVSGTASLVFDSNDGLGTANTPSLRLFRNASSGWTKFEIGANSSGSSQNAGIWVNGGGEVRYVAAASWFPTFYSHGNEAMRISTTGNVGIGTTTPTRLLDVAGAIHLSPTVTPGSPLAGDLFFDSAASNSLKYHNGSSWVSIGSGTGDFMKDGSVAMTGALRHIAGTAGAPGMTFAGDTANGIFAPLANNLGLATSGTERMRILANGNVGIGTSSPNRLLEVAGPIRVSPTTLPGTPAAGDIAFDSANANTLKYHNGSAWVSVAGASAVSGTNNYLTKFTSASTVGNSVMYETGGYIGIGTTSPLRQLHVANSAGWSESLIENTTMPSATLGRIWTQSNDGAGRLVFRAANSDISSNAAPLAMYSNGSVGVGATFAGTALASMPANGMIVQGNVGIGTTSPNWMLTNSSASNFTDQTPLGLAGSNSFVWEHPSSNSTLGYASAIANSYSAASASGLLVKTADTNTSTRILTANSGGTDRLVVRGDGNVGIGTTSPGYKLDVQGGDINASGSVRAAGVALTSDIRYKRDIEPLDNALEKILNIRGVTYNWRADEFPQKHFNDRHQVGVIAQEVEQQFPEVVDTNSDGYKSVNYPALVAPLIEAVKSLYNRIVGVESHQAIQDREIASVKAQKADKAEIEALKAKNKELEHRLELLEKSLNSK